MGQDIAKVAAQAIEGYQIRLYMKVFQLSGLLAGSDEVGVGVLLLKEEFASHFHGIDNRHHVAWVSRHGDRKYETGLHRMSKEEELRMRSQGHVSAVGNAVSISIADQFILITVKEGAKGTARSERLDVVGQFPSFGRPGFGCDRFDNLPRLDARRGCGKLRHRSPAIRRREEFGPGRNWRSFCARRNLTERCYWNSVQRATGRKC